MALLLGKASPKIEQLASERIRISLDNGIRVETPSYTLALDPKKPSSCDYSFISHAHLDHVHSPDQNSKVLASSETAKLANLRGYKLGRTLEEAHGIELIDSGHIFGSKSILIEDRVFYTGDISTRNRAFLKGCRGVKCDTLIMETTYGRPHYIFPRNEDIIKEVNAFISRCFDRGRPVILTGYPLGKAQMISYFLENWDPVYLHDAVHKMNRAHIEMGVNIRDFASLSAESERKLSQGPWLLIAPMSSGRSKFIREMKQKFNAAVAAFSGWSIDRGYKFEMGLDEAFAVSDHCDFKELVDLAKFCDPSMIYTVHGFAKEFADYLSTLGFEAQPLSEGTLQERITNYA